jgi:hypothetical protein
VRRAFDAGKHKTLATLRRDGAPRISGTELDFFDGRAYLGSMLGAVKARDLLHDPRCALHSATIDTELTATGDAKLSGRAIEVTDRDEVAAFVRRGQDAGREEPPDAFHLFRVDIDDVSLLTMGDPPDHLVVEHWKAGRGLVRSERR